MSRSRFEWPIFQLTINKSWRTARVNIGATVFSHLYKRSTRRTNSKVKLFADGTSLFSIVNCVNTSASTLNSDLLKIQDWTYQWKMSFNQDRTKRAQEIIFSRKKNATTIHHSLSTILKLSLVQIRSIWDLL